MKTGRKEGAAGSVDRKNEQVCGRNRTIVPKLFLLCTMALLIAFCGLMTVQCTLGGSDGTADSGTGSGAQGSANIPQLFYRDAKNSDIVMDNELDLSSFGAKYTIMPQVDIEGLTITIRFLDENRNVLKEFVKYLGNVKEGVQVSFSLSLFDLGISVAWNTKYENWSVSGGSVSYFA